MFLAWWLVVISFVFAAANIQLKAIGALHDGRRLEEDPYPKKPGKRIPLPELYHRKYSEQTFIATHDSAAIRTEENNWSISGNQYFSPAGELLLSVVRA